MPHFALNQKFLFCFIVMPLYKHNICAATDADLSGNFRETNYNNSTDLFAKSTPTTSDQYTAKISQKERQSSNNGYMNWTREDLTTLLKQHGYLVKKDPEGWPLGVIGDIVYDPEDLLPEMGMLQNRRNLLATKNLWVDGDKETVVPYYYDTGTRADEKTFEAAVKSWSDNTCIKFSKQPPNHCKADLGQAAVCVGNFGGCWSKLGRKYNKWTKHSQQMSVQPKGCEDVAAAHEFGHALGMHHEMARTDRDDHIHVLYRNIDLKLDKLTDNVIRGAWIQGSKCSTEQMYNAPKPYDPMSIMQYGTSDFAKEDQRPVYLHKNPHYQYMFDYHRKAGYFQTHYDILVMNVGYNCIKKWKKSCEYSGKSVPKCQNYGYVGKDCACKCPQGFSGSTCGTKTGPMFPVQDRAKAMLDVTEPGLVDMKGKGMHDENHNYPKSNFNKWQYIAVIIRSGDGTRISVDVAQNFKNVERYFTASQSHWLSDGKYECRYGIHVYVGHSEVAKVRVECISSMVNNEPKDHRTVLRSKTNALDIMGVGGWAVCYMGGPSVTRMAMEFQFTISFLDRPEDKLSIEQKNPGKSVGAVDDAKENEDETKEGEEAMTAESGGSNVPVIIAVVAVFILLMAGGGGGVAYWKYRTSKSDDDDDSDEEKPKPAETEHDSPDDGTSDSSD